MRNLAVWLSIVCMSLMGAGCASSRQQRGNAVTMATLATVTTSALPTPTHTPTLTGTPEPTSSRTPTATPDLRVILAPPITFVPAVEEIPPGAGIYVLSSNDRISAEVVIATWNREAATEYLERTSFLAGWLVGFSHGFNAATQPEWLGCDVRQYATEAGARLAVLEYNGAERGSPRMSYIEGDPFTLGDTTAIFRRIGDDMTISYFVNFSYRNYEVLVVGTNKNGVEVPVEPVQALARIVLSKLEVADLSASPAYVRSATHTAPVPTSHAEATVIVVPTPTSQ